MTLLKFYLPLHRVIGAGRLQQRGEPGDLPVDPQNVFWLSGERLEMYSDSICCSIQIWVYICSHSFNQR